MPAAVEADRIVFGNEWSECVAINVLGAIRLCSSEGSAARLDPRWFTKKADHVAIGRSNGHTNERYSNSRVPTETPCNEQCDQPDEYKQENGCLVSHMVSDDATALTFYPHQFANC